jgi:hypothetical protein
VDPVAANTVSRRTALLLALAIVLAGLLAGLDFDRAIVAMPAWQIVGPVAWAEFSRHADLGSGLVLYPVEAIGAFLLAVATAISARFDRAAPKRLIVVLWISVALAAGGLATTILAAPVMLSIAHETDAAALQRAFEAFHFWGNVRGLCQVLAFTALAIAALTWSGANKAPK